MPTYIYNKKDLIDFINKEVSDNQVVVLTNELTGNLSLSKKNGIKVTHQYAHDTFKDIGIGHLAFNKSHALGIIIADKERLSEKSKGFIQ